MAAGVRHKTLRFSGFPRIKCGAGWVKPRMTAKSCGDVALQVKEVVWQIPNRSGEAVRQLAFSLHSPFDTLVASGAAEGG